MSSSKRILFFIILIAFLASACGSLPSKGRNDATATSAPTLMPVLPTLTPTSTLEFVPVTEFPTPLPTPQPPPILTPDAIQVERWKEYQTELAKVLLYGYDIDPSKDALCEWDILGRLDQKVYVWAYCYSKLGNTVRPAVIYLDADGAIREVNVARYEGPFYDLELFPAEVREKLNVYIFPPYSDGRPQELRQHLEYRQTHPEEPPLVVFSATPTP